MPIVQMGLSWSAESMNSTESLPPWSTETFFLPYFLQALILAFSAFKLKQKHEFFLGLHLWAFELQSQFWFQGFWSWWFILQILGITSFHNCKLNLFSKALSIYTCVCVFQIQIVSPYRYICAFCKHTHLQYIVSVYMNGHTYILYLHICVYTYVFWLYSIILGKSSLMYLVCQGQSYSQSLWYMFLNNCKKVIGFTSIS